MARRRHIFLSVHRLLLCLLLFSPLPPPLPMATPPPRCPCRRKSSQARKEGEREEKAQNQKELLGERERERERRKSVGRKDLSPPPFLVTVYTQRPSFLSSVTAIRRRSRSSSTSTFSLSLFPLTSRFSKTLSLSVGSGGVKKGPGGREGGEFESTCDSAESWKGKKKRKTGF